MDEQDTFQDIYQPLQVAPEIQRYFEIILKPSRTRRQFDESEVRKEELWDWLGDFA